MKTKLLLTVLAIVSLIPIAQSQTLVTNVTANPLWTDTGLYLTNGEWVSINAAGFWMWPETNDPDGWLGQDYDYFLNTGDVHGSLIGFQGENPYQGSYLDTNAVFQTNQYFEVGTARQFMSTTNGELWLGINDDAFTGNTNDNSGFNDVAISLGFSHCDNYSNMTLSVATVTSNSFSFHIHGGIPNTVCAIYDSADLSHWTLLDSLILDTNGSSAFARDNDPPSDTSGLISGAFVNFTSVPYRFYKVSNGPFWSQAIGFDRITVGANATNFPADPFIADQLLDQSNTLNELFIPMADGSSLPNGSVIEKLDVATQSLVDYTYTAGSWSPNGNATLLPGEGGILLVSNTVTVTFAGLVPQGCLTNYLAPTNDFTLVSAQIPQAGGITSFLGYTPQDLDVAEIWTGTVLQAIIYYDAADAYPDPAGWYDTSGNPAEPVMRVGESVYLQDTHTNAEYWVRKFPGCCEP